VYLLARVFSSAVFGPERLIIETEVDAEGGLPKLAIKELPDGTVAEVRERRQSAIKTQFKITRPVLFGFS